ncbi:MAG: fibronectin type III domain-containing protein [Patescibacteria group bacterium]
MDHCLFMQAVSQIKRKSFMEKRIPTLLGMGILVVSLIAGLLFFSQGTGVFAPRATPQTTPKNVRLTNITDNAFTISFYTDEATSGFVKYGESPEKINLQASDDRSQLSGVVEKNTLHHITIKGLQPGKTYYYLLGTSSNATFDNEGAAFSVTTARKPTTPPPANQTIYGSVVTSGNTPAEGSVVYVTIDGVMELSALVRQSGSWAIPLSDARTKDGSNYATVTDSTPVNIFVQGKMLTQTASSVTTIAEAHPVTNISLGQNASVSPALSEKNSAETSSSSSQSAQLEGAENAQRELSMAGVGGGETNRQKTTNHSETDVNQDLSVSQPTSTPSPSPTQKPTAMPTPTRSATASSDLISSANATGSSSSSAAAILDLEVLASDPELQVVAQEAPMIKGKAAANVVVTIEVHSDTQITQTVTADDNGDFTLDIASLSQNLEPGEHTVTYSYTDPTTGEEVTKTHTFYVEDKPTQTLALAYTPTPSPTKKLTATPTPTTTPYGSGNPYPITSPTPTKVATNSADTSTRSAIVSTDSGMLKSGSVGTTLALMIAGCFFVFTGAWSWWLAGQIEEESVG